MDAKVRFPDLSMIQYIFLAPEGVLFAKVENDYVLLWAHGFEWSATVVVHGAVDI